MLELCWLATSMLIVTVSTSGQSTNPLVVGIFDRVEHNVSFYNTINNYTNIRTISLVPKEMGYGSLLDSVCALKDTLFIYAITSNEYIQLLAAVTVTLQIPLFAYGTDNMTQVMPSNDLHFFMNDAVRDEGTVFASIARLSTWPHLTLVIHEDLYGDGLVDSFNGVFTDSHHLFITHEIVYRTSQTVASLLIRLHSHISSRVTDPQGYLPTYEVVLLHLPAHIIAELLDGADLLFHNIRVVWLISSTGQVMSLPNIKQGVVTLQTPYVDSSFISESVGILMDRLRPLVDTGKLNKVSVCNSTSVLNSWSAELSHWFEYLDQADVVSHHKLNYYRYLIHTTAENGEWSQVGEFSSVRNPAVPNLDKAVPSKKRQSLTVVTILDKPFVYKNSPLRFEGNPYCQTPAVLCLGIPDSVIRAHGYSSHIVQTVFKDFDAGAVYPNRSYDIYCCEGLAMDLLQSLSSELEFDYQIYISPDGAFGAYNSTSGNWSGMVKEVLDGRADMVAASFSIISSRSEVIDFTAPYYHSGFTLMASQRESNETRYFSFLEPFPFMVWLVFLLLAIVTFLALAVLEWKSPFGMNPSHDKDIKSYSLASAIKTIFSLMSGSNLPCKAPSSWPGKWTQNLWGFFGIIYLAAYTANLTSSIAGGPLMLQVSGYHDKQLLKLQVAAPSDSAAEIFMKTVRPELYERMREHKITDSVAGTYKIRNGELDVFIHDTSIIEYIISQENYDCTLYILSKIPGDSYGSAFPQNKYQDLKAAVSGKYLEYQQSGYIDKLKRVYFPPAKECVSTASDNEKIELTTGNAAGMFILLLGMVVLSFFLLGLEHVIYRYVIPHAKRQPAGSFWKSTGLMFISQRIHRAIMKDGAGTGGSVFRSFALTLAKSTSVFNIGKKYGSKAEEVKLTFYDVVSMAYETKFNRPLVSILLQEHRSKSRTYKDSDILTRIKINSRSWRRKHSTMSEMATSEYHLNRWNGYHTSAGKDNNGYRLSLSEPASRQLSSKSSSNGVVPSHREEIKLPHTAADASRRENKSIHRPLLRSNIYPSQLSLPDQLLSNGNDAMSYPLLPPQIIVTEGISADTAIPEYVSEESNDISMITGNIIPLEPVIEIHTNSNHQTCSNGVEQRGTSHVTKF